MKSVAPDDLARFERKGVASRARRVIAMALGQLSNKRSLEALQFVFEKCQNL
jgi:hypothetical protein